MNAREVMTASSRRVYLMSTLILGSLLSFHDGSGLTSLEGGGLTAPAKDGIVKLGESNIEYFSQGQGEPIVLLPFGGLTIGYLDGLSQALADAGYQVIRINFRGSGKSTGSGQGVTLHTLADDVAGVIRSLKLGPVNIAGHAFGNRVARTLAADHPEMVRSVILFAAGGMVPPKPPGEQALATIFNPASTDAEVLMEMKYMVGDPADIPKVWKTIKPSRAPQAAGIERTAMSSTPLKDWWAPAGEMKYLVLQGAEDQIALPANAELLKEQLGARVTLISFPRAGHMLPVEQPKKASAAVVSFLR